MTVFTKLCLQLSMNFIFVTHLFSGFRTCGEKQPQKYYDHLRFDQIEMQRLLLRFFFKIRVPLSSKKVQLVNIQTYHHLLISDLFSGLKPTFCENSYIL